MQMHHRERVGFSGAKRRGSSLAERLIANPGIAIADHYDTLNGQLEAVQEGTEAIIRIEKAMTIVSRQYGKRWW